jgi:hypothetical protein
MAYHRRPSRPSRRSHGHGRPSGRISHRRGNPSNCSIVDRAEIVESMQVHFEFSSMATQGYFTEAKMDEFIRVVKEFQAMVYAQVAEAEPQFSIKPDDIYATSHEATSTNHKRFCYCKATFDFPNTQDMPELSHLDDYDHQDIIIRIQQVFVDWLIKNDIQSNWGHEADDRIERPY